MTTSQLKKTLAKHKLNFEEVCEKHLEVALLQKFSDKNKQLKEVLLNTQTATLTHWNRGTCTVQDDNGTKVAKSCYLTKLLEHIRDTMHNHPPVIKKDEDVQCNGEPVMIESSQTDLSKGLKILAKKDINDFKTFMNTYDPSKNRSVNVLTIYEKTNIIGIRMEQLSMGAKSYLNSEQLSGLNNVKDIAFREFHLKKIPFLICRKFSDNIKEYWRLEDLIY